MGYAKSLDQVVSHVSSAPVVIDQKLVDVFVPGDSGKVQDVELTSKPGRGLMSRIMKGEIFNSRFSNRLEKQGADAGRVASEPLRGLAFGYSLDQTNGLGTEWDNPTLISFGDLGAKRNSFTIQINVSLLQTGDFPLPHRSLDSEQESNGDDLTFVGHRYLFGVSQDSTNQGDLFFGYPSFSWRWISRPVSVRRRRLRCPLPLDRFFKYVRDHADLPVNGRTLDRLHSILNKFFDVLGFDLAELHSKKSRVVSGQGVNSYRLPAFSLLGWRNLVGIPLSCFKKSVAVDRMLFIELLPNPLLSPALSRECSSDTSSINENPCSPVSALQSSETPCHKPSVSNRVTNSWQIITNFIVGIPIIWWMATNEGLGKPLNLLGKGAK